MPPELLNEETWLEAERPAKRRNGWLIAVLSLLTIGIYTIYWLYRLHRELPSRDQKDLSGRVWLGIFAALTVVMFGFLLSSGFGS